MTHKCLVLLSKIIKSHISKADRKRQIFISLKSLGECKDVIDCLFYNIFELRVFWCFIGSDDLPWSQFATSKCSYDIPSVVYCFWGFYEARVHAAVLDGVSFAACERLVSSQTTCCRNYFWANIKGYYFLWKFGMCFSNASSGFIPSAISFTKAFT